MHFKSFINKVNFIKYISKKLLKCTYCNKKMKAYFNKCRYTYFVHK